MCRYISSEYLTLNPLHLHPLSTQRPRPLSPSHPPLHHQLALLIKLFFTALCLTLSVNILYCLLLFACSPLSLPLSLSLSVSLFGQTQITANLIISYANRVYHKRTCYEQTGRQRDRQTVGVNDLFLLLFFLSLFAA